MSLLDRFLNPVWRKALKLDANRQRVFAMVISSYGGCRKFIETELIGPVEPCIITAIASNKPLPSKVKEQLVDEALVGLLRCGTSPDSDPTGKIPAQIFRNLPEVLGAFALADINHRLNRSTPNVLGQSQYSTDPDEARTQVLTKWMLILGISTPHFVNRANASGFTEAWGGLTKSMLSGMLIGFARTPDDVVLAKARRLAAEIPPHRVPLVEYFIEVLAKASFGHDAPKQQRGTPLARTALAEEAKPPSTPTKKIALIEERLRDQATPNWMRSELEDMLKELVVAVNPKDESPRTMTRPPEGASVKPAMAAKQKTREVDLLTKNGVIKIRVPDYSNVGETKAYPDRAEFLKKGRAVPQNPDAQDFELIVRQLACVMRPHLKDAEMRGAERWVTRITGRPIRNGIWLREHEEAFALGFERFAWEGNAPTEDLREQFLDMKSWLREKYPILAGSPINVELDDDMRLVYRTILGSDAKS